MKKVKIKLIVIIMLISYAASFAQKIGVEEHNKYWYYRQRLINEFLVVGTEPTYICNEGSGFSLPAIDICDEHGKFTICEINPSKKFIL